MTKTKPGTLKLYLAEYKKGNRRVWKVGTTNKVDAMDHLKRYSRLNKKFDSCKIWASAYLKENDAKMLKRKINDKYPIARVGSMTDGACRLRHIPFGEAWDLSANLRKI